jgi:DNA invertase Pin-like site-specific DNA recombinase
MRAAGYYRKSTQDER